MTQGKTDNPRVLEIVERLRELVECRVPAQFKTHEEYGAGIHAYRNGVMNEAADMLSLLVGDGKDAASAEDMRERCADVLRKKAEHYGEGYEALLRSCIEQIESIPVSGDGEDRPEPAGKEDAERWRALMASQRMHYMGSANFAMTQKDPAHGNKLYNLIPTPKPGEYMHFGMEFWSEYKAGEGTDSFERQLLTAYVDEIIKRGSPALHPSTTPRERTDQ